MDGEGARGVAPRFEKLDEDYRTRSTYCRAYLRDKGVWIAVVNPRPDVGINPGPATLPLAEPPASAAAHASTPSARAVYDK